MKTINSSYVPHFVVKDVPRVKTVGLQVGVSDHELATTIKTAFELAKSAGRELDLTFGMGDPSQPALHSRAAGLRSSEIEIGLRMFDLPQGRPGRKPQAHPEAP